ncbi:methyltransferase domain-containing protein [Streptomyces sp. Isolate_45]|uniref:methyltransferase domain-containing protein n=1 Tax=Streptomyces sp. Isolate_45 TaxID=2950111 RepID=UPI002481C997|nr:methyltransferase domain-containing protein [Streptomyces sp. Isolate_45]MDA5279063.1 methyltransferase domain-containing protein [Streptomyces sp. Isolate_45]
MTERATTEADPQGLASRLMDSGALTSDWLPAYQAVLRESFVPDVIWPGVGPADGGPVASIDRRTDPEGWFRAVYSDTSLTTQWDDGSHTGPDRGNIPTCSNSQPAMVFSMLAALDLQPGAKVLEVGTGTGWNAALLSERVGSENVTTIEFDPENAATARARLDAAGYNPVAVVGDGSQGWAACAPYDRVLITASLREIPADIFQQTRPGGIIVSPYATEYGGEAVVRLTVQEDGSASGPFVGSSAFMRLRQQRAYRTHVKTYLGGKPWPADGRRTTTSLSPADVADWLPMFAIGLQTEGMFPYPERLDGGRYTLWLRDTQVTSWASIDFVPDAEEFEVYQSGPRELWSELTAAHAWWDDQGRPAFERFGLTVNPDGTAWAWLDSREHPVPAVG